VTSLETGISVFDITEAIRARRRCVPAALIGYVVSGWLGVLPLAFLIGLLSGRGEVTSGLAIFALAFLVLAVAVAVTSWSAERGSRAGAVLENLAVGWFLGYLVYFVQQTGANLETLTGTRETGPARMVSWPVLAVGVVAAAGILTSLSGLVAAFRYQRLVPAQAASEARPGFIRRLQGAAALLRTAKGRLAIVYLLAMGACFILPATFGMAFMERGLRDSSVPAPGWNMVVTFVVLMIVCIEVGKRLFAKAKRLRQVQASDARRLDSRRPVLLLRSFQDDLTPIQRRLDVRNQRFGSTADLPLTLEEVLEHVLWTYGPVIAIGRPDEALPPAGAAREYVRNDEWLQRVNELVAESQRIVLIVGRTQGLSLEYASLASAQVWPKVILTFPPVERAELLARWAVFAQVASRTPSGVPEADPPADALVATFAPGGQSRFVTSQWRDDESYELAIRSIMGRGTK
jgi:hypothetical protein